MNSHPSKPRRPFKLLTVGTLVLVLAGVEAISYALERSNPSAQAPVSVILAQFGGFGGNQGGQGDQGDQGGYGDQGDEPPPPPRRRQPRPSNPPSNRRPSTPKRGALDQLVQRTVGDFELKNAQRDNSAIQQGAIDAIQMEYESSDGVQLAHYLIALQTANQATQGAQNIAQTLQQKLDLAGEGDVKDRDGQVQGHIWVFQGQNGQEVVLWHNNQLVAMAGSAEGYAVQFMKDLPY